MVHKPIRLHENSGYRRGHFSETHAQSRIRRPLESGEGGLRPWCSLDPLPGRPLPRAHWTGTCSQLPSTPGPRGSGTRPPEVGPQPPAPAERCVSTEREAEAARLTKRRAGTEGGLTLPRWRCVSLRRSGWCFPTRRIMSSYSLCFLNMVMARSGSSTVTYSLGKGDALGAS